MKNKHLRNDYHIKAAEAELTPSQLTKANNISIYALYKREAERSEKAIKGMFVKNIFTALNLTKYS